MTCWRCEFASLSILALLSLNEEMGRVGSFHFLILTLKVRMYLMGSEGKELVVMYIYIGIYIYIYIGDQFEARVFQAAHLR